MYTPIYTFYLNIKNIFDHSYRLFNLCTRYQKIICHGFGR